MLDRFSIEVRTDNLEDAEDQLSDIAIEVMGVVKSHLPDAEFEVVHDYIGHMDRKRRDIHPEAFGRRTFRVHPEGLPGHG